MKKHKSRDTFWTHLVSQGLVILFSKDCGSTTDSSYYVFVIKNLHQIFYLNPLFLYVKKLLTNQICSLWESVLFDYGSFQKKIKQLKIVKNVPGRLDGLKKCLRLFKIKEMFKKNSIKQKKTIKTFLFVFYISQGEDEKNEECFRLI